MKDVIDELNQLATKPVATEELTNTKNYLAGLYLLGLETQSCLAGQLSNMKALGLPNDYLETYTTRVRSVGEINSAMKYLVENVAQS